jgi:hypothetical protein
LPALDSDVLHLRDVLYAGVNLSIQGMILEGFVVIINKCVWVSKQGVEEIILLDFGHEKLPQLLEML